MRRLISLSISILFYLSSGAQSYIPDDTLVYKTTQETELSLHLFYPNDQKSGENRAVVISFFGGGWVGGHPRQFYPQSEYFASLGMVAISAEYRVKSKHQTTPFECVKDGKSVVRWVRQHAKQLGIDPSKIVVCGGSAGGHVAACTALIQGHEEADEDLSVSSKPNAMILMNPVLDTTKKGYGAEKVKGHETEISPCHQVKTNLPPCIFFHGTQDKTVPYENVVRFEKLMKQAGNDCLLIPAIGEDHGFFNPHCFRKKNTDEWFKYSMYQSEIFLWKNGYLSKQPDTWAFSFRNDAFQKMKLKSENYHTHRDGLKNSQIKFIKDKKGTVAFLGGSITYNKGWRDLVCRYLQERFPKTKFTFIEAGIPSEGTTSASFRLVRDVLSKGEIDLLFEEAAVNDRSLALRRSRIDQLRGMEGIVRHARNANPSIDIVMMHFVDEGKITQYNEGKIPEVIKNHESVTDHYKLPSINLAKEVADRIKSGEFTWKDDFKNVHPSPFGQEIYFESMKTFLDNAYYGFVADDDKVVNYEMPEAIDPFAYDRGTFISIEKAKYKKGWKIDSSWTPVKQERVRKGFTNIPYLVATGDRKTVKLSFTGRAIGFIGLSGPDAGTIEFSIDGGAYQKFDQYTVNSYYQHLPRYFVLASELALGEKHILKLRLAETANPKSKGNACRILNFFVNE